MTSSQLIGDREKLADAQQRIRDGLVAFAAYLAGRGTSEQVLAALCPPGVDPAVRESAFLDLLHFVDQAGPDRSRPLPHDAEIDLNQMTGVR